MYVVAALLLVPFVGGGVYTLDCRYRRQEEWPLAAEAVVLAAVAAFLAVEVALLRGMLAQNTVYLIFAVLGLCVAASALYGHVLVSVLSRLLVEAVAGAEEGARDRPRFGPAEALERQGAHGDALQEYLVLARIFPREAEVHARIATCHLVLGDPAEAAKWWRRAFKYATAPGDALRHTLRLADTCAGPLGDAAAAREAMEAYLRRHSKGPDADAVRERIARIDAPADSPKPLSAGLAALDEAPLEETPGEIDVPHAARQRIQLEPLEHTATEPTPDTAVPATPPPRPAKLNLALTPLDDGGIPVEPAVSAEPADPPRRFNLTPLDAAPLEDPDRE